MFAKRAYDQSVYFSLAFLLISSMLLTACGGGEPPIPTTTPTKLPPTVKLTVSTVNVQEGKEAAILVELQPYAELEWKWEVSGSSEGTLNKDTGETVIYTAGKAGIDTVTARAKLADGTPVRESVTINVEPAATEVPPPTDTPEPPRVTLAELKPEQKVPCANSLSGTYPAGLEKHIWPVVYVGGKYHPQDEGGKSAQTVDGRWYQTVRFGNCDANPETDKGVRFQLIIFTANDSANAAFEAYISNGQKTGQWPGMTELPPGLEEQLRIVVIRE